MEPPFDKLVVKTLGDEFGFKSKLFQQFVYYILEEKLKDIVQFKMLLGNEPCLTIYDIPDKESGSIINDFASIIEPIIFYKLHDFNSPTVNEKPPNLDKELYQRILPQSGGYDSDPPKKINKKTINTSYIKFENYGDKPKYGHYYDNPKPEKEVVDIRRNILSKAIEYNLQYIINDFIKNHTEIIDGDVLQQVIKTHNMSLFDDCLPFVQTDNPSVLQTAVQEKQDDMIYKLLKSGASISTDCVLDICKLDEPQKILIWVNLYGNDSSVDYDRILSKTSNINVIKLLIHHTDPTSVVNNAITRNNLELFKAFINLVNDKTHVIKKCITSHNLAMVQFIYEHNQNDETFNQIFTTAVNNTQHLVRDIFTLGDKTILNLDIVKYIVQFDNEISESTWENVRHNLDKLCNQDILPYIFDRCPYKSELFLNAVSKNDEWSVEYIIDKFEIRLSNFNDVVFKQAVINKNKNILNMLLKLKRYSSEGLDTLLELDLVPEIEEILKNIYTSTPKGNYAHW